MKKRQYFSSEGVFVGGCDNQVVSKLVRSLAQQCVYCKAELLTFCIEQCCIGKPPFCPECDAHEHFTHRTNQLKLLLLNRKTVQTNAVVKGKLLISITDMLEKAIEQSQAVIQTHLQFIELCKLTVAETCSIFESLKSQHDQLNQISAIAESALLLPIDPNQAREMFARATASIDLYRSLPQLQTFNQIDSFLAWKSVRVSSSILLEPIRQAVKEFNQGSPDCLEKILKTTAIQCYLSKPPQFLRLVLKHRPLICQWRDIISGNFNFQGTRLVIHGQPTLYCGTFDYMPPDILITEPLPGETLPYLNQLSNLRELSIQCLMPRFPACLQRLHITLQDSDVANLSRILPAGLRSLSLIIKSNSYYGRKKPVDWYPLLFAIADLKHLQQLELWDDSPSIPDFVLKRVMRKGIQGRMRMVCVSFKGRRGTHLIKWDQFSKELACCRSIHLRLFKQVAVLHRNPRLSMIHNSFRESLLQAACLVDSPVVGRR